MKKFILTMIFIVSLFALKNVFATAAHDLEILLAQSNSVKANFSQILADEKGKIIQKTEGQVYIQKPDRFRWQILKPNPQLIVADGKILWIYDEDLEQVSKKPMEKNLSETPAALLSGKGQYLSKNYRIEKQGAWFVLMPKNNDNTFQLIKFKFSGKNLQKMQLRDRLGQNSLLEFFDMQTNVQINPKLFQFTPSKNMDVVS